MSWSIPTKIEEDFQSGKAEYRSFQTGVGAQSILTVPANAYIIIFGYDFSPSGGGLISGASVSGNTVQPGQGSMGPFGTQQLSFFTGTDFYPFIHHCDIVQAHGVSTATTTFFSVNNSPITRQVYIKSTQDVTITHGLINTATAATTGTIPVTSRTPLGLTFGGSGLNIQAQTNYGNFMSPLQFLQPSIKDFSDFGLGLVPANANDQAFATPHGTAGLLPSQSYVQSILASELNNANVHYYLCCHYALYSKTVPEQLG